MSTQEMVLTAIQTARRYTNDLLEHTQPVDWFRQPADGVTHIAWQVGHLAVAQHRLALRRVHGERPDHELLVPEGFRKLFGKGSVPGPDVSQYPPANEIRSVFDRVYDRVVAENGNLDDRTLSEPVDRPPHPMFDTKGGALRWTAEHEFIHAGQIALLRRLLGYEPRR